MEHERKRFSTMTHRQLVTRLNKITHIDKLVRFIFCAEEFGKMELVRLAEEKLNYMRGKRIEVRTTTVTVERKKDKVIVEETHTRAIDFE